MIMNHYKMEEDDDQIDINLIFTVQKNFIVLLESCLKNDAIIAR